MKNESNSTKKCYIKMKIFISISTCNDDNFLKYAVRNEKFSCDNFCVWLDLILIFNWSLLRKTYWMLLTQTQIRLLLLYFIHFKGKLVIISDSVNEFTSLRQLCISYPFFKWICYMCELLLPQTHHNIQLVLFVKSTLQN